MSREDHFLNEDLRFEKEATMNEEEEEFDGKKNIEMIHSKIDSEAIPEVGMEFETEEQAYTFYNAYAYKVGFGIRRSKFYRRNTVLVSRTFCCSREGHREKDKRDDLVKSHQAETRCFCLARMKVSNNLTGKFRVYEFVAEHTHVTTTSENSHLHRSKRKLTPAQKKEIDMAEISGITPKQSCELMARRAGGRENVGFIPIDCRNYLRTRRTGEMRLGDTGGVFEYFQRMKLRDPAFFSDIQLDEDDMITNIFWADGKMLVDYSYFGDVVSFDTTYRKNKDCRPFAMFLGVNHHRQTIIFGAALLYDETAESFIWLFNTFVEAMSGKKPKTILTYQDAAMSKALGLQWPETSHRLCIWHLYQNAAKHLSGVFERYREFSKDFSSCIDDYEEEDDFLEAWNSMLKKHDLNDNDWLKRMFKFKEKWALVYGRETFCANMTTTQPSESMNNSIKGYVSYKHDLVRFFENFERLIEDRRNEELVVDFKAGAYEISK